MVDLCFILYLAMRYCKWEHRKVCTVMRNELFQKSCLMKTSPNNLRKLKSADFAGFVKILKNLLRENSSASYLIKKLHTFLALISARTSFCGFRRKKFYNCVLPILHMKILFILFMQKKNHFLSKKKAITTNAFDTSNITQFMKNWNFPII